MKRLQTLMARCLVLALAVCLATFVPATYAVVKDLSIVDGEGKSLANTKVTIVFPDGTEVDEETDDDGMLYYDFPQDGEYTVRYPGGEMAVNVGGGGGGGMSTGKMIGAGAAAIAIIGIGVVASDSGRDSDSSSSSSSSSDPGGSSGSGGSGSGFPAVCDMATFSASTSVESDPDGHNPVGPPGSYDGPWETFCPSSTQVNLTSQVGGGAPPWSCNLQPDGSCDAPPTICSWAGMNTSCSLSSQFTAMSWDGTMSIGVDGSLPDTNMNGMNEPLVLVFSAPRQ